MYGLYKSYFNKVSKYKCICVFVVYICSLYNGLYN